MAPPAKLMQVLALGLVAVLGLFWLLPSSPAPSSLAAAWASSSPGSHTGPPSLTADDISLLYESRRLAKLADYDVATDEAEFRFRDLGETLPAYVARLRSFVLEAFPSHLQPPLLESIARLEHQLPPDPDRPPISRKIYTTNKSKFDLPPSFAEWKTMQPDWAVDVLDDDGMEDWIDQYFGKGGAAHEMGPVWRALPKIVLKSDSLRYLIMLLEGGVYSDSDTMPVAPADGWGHDYDAHRLQDPQLKLLAHLHSGLVDHASALRQAAPPGAALATSRQHPIMDPTISGVVGVEIDITRSVEPDFVRQWFARLVQFTQWTLMFKPYHPIYIDLLETVYRKAVKTEQDLALGKIKPEQIEDTLNFTGPGPYTDAIFRYFLIHLGVTPRECTDVSGSFRLGDIVLLSQYSFSQPLDKDARNDWGAVHHDFAGRWRHDG